MTDDEQSTLDLPDFLPKVPDASAAPLVKAVEQTIQQLMEDGHIARVDVGKVQLALELAEVIAIKKATRRASTIGNDARVLMEILDAFVAETDEDGDEQLRAAMDAWTQRVAEFTVPGEVVGADES